MKFKDTKYLSAYLFAVVLFFTLKNEGYYWAVPIVAFVLLPILEMLVPQSKDNFSPEEEKDRETSKIFDLLQYLNLPLIFVLLFMSLHHLIHMPLSVSQTLGLVFSTGIIMSTNGINVAHEIGHRPSFLDQTISRVMLMPSLYMHFNLEHNLGHHRNVATPIDPATAKYGESFYTFLPKSLIGGFRGAWNIEKKILQKKGLDTWSYQNRILQFQAIQLFFLAGIFFLMGTKAMVCAFFIGLISSSLLEAINYVEHYGLQRKKLNNGKYEPVQSHHSWNSDHTMGRIMLYELTRHSDHHFKSTRKFQILRSHQESPELPLGYPGSILLSLFPPLWFKIMNPIVLANKNYT